MYLAEEFYGVAQVGSLLERQENQQGGVPATAGRIVCLERLP
jgi:hypothetical protein